jgi:hypothetical protein
MTKETEAKTVTPVMEKKCPKCGRTLPAADFWKMKNSKDGLQPQCKDCQMTKNPCPLGTHTSQDKDGNPVEKKPKENKTPVAKKEKTAEKKSAPKKKAEKKSKEENTEVPKET